MSKKVVHLADDAHELAKAYCKDSGMKMSDWVAMLIKRAVEPGKPAPAPQAPMAQYAPQSYAAPVVATHQESSYAARNDHYNRIPDTTPARVASASISAAQPQQFNQRAVTTAVAPSERTNQTVRIGDSVHGVIPKKKPMVRELSSEGEDQVPAYAQPPFWARAKG